MKAHILKKTKVPCWVYNLSLDILIDCNQTDGGGVKSTVRNHREEILSGIDQDGIHVFGSQGEGYIRFSLCVSSEIIKEAISRF